MRVFKIFIVLGFLAVVIAFPAHRLAGAEKPQAADKKSANSEPQTEAATTQQDAGRLASEPASAESDDPASNPADSDDGADGTGSDDGADNADNTNSDDSPDSNDGPASDDGKDSPESTESTESDEAADSDSEADSASAEQPTLLRYRFQPGQFVHYEVDAKSKMVLMAREQTQTLRESRRTKKHFRVISVDDDGTAVVEPVIDHVVMEARSDDEPPVVFDSDDPDTDAKDFQQVKQTIGRAAVQLRFTSVGHLEDVLPLQPLESGKSVKPDPAKHGFLVALPEKPVQAGDTWSDDYSISVSVDGQLRKPLTKRVQIRRLYTLKEIEDGIAEIEFRTYPLAVERNPQVKVQLVQQSLAGTVKFDISRGLIIEWKSRSSGNVFGAFGPTSSMQAKSRRVERYVADPSASKTKKQNPKPAGPAGPQLPGETNLQAAAEQ